MDHGCQMLGMVPHRYGSDKEVLEAFNGFASACQVPSEIRPRSDPAPTYPPPHRQTSCYLLTYLPLTPSFAVVHGKGAHSASAWAGGGRQRRHRLGQQGQAGGDQLRFSRRAATHVHMHMHKMHIR